MTNLELCQNILKSQKNDHTKVKVIDSNKGGYYSYLTDSIYIPEKKYENSVKNLVILCHECIHSTQSKSIHTLNVVLSNLELIVFLCAIISVVYNLLVGVSIPLYLFICVISIIFRCVLEIPAMVGSFNIAKKFCNNSEVDAVCEAQKQAKKKLFLGVLSFCWGRLFRTIIVIVLYVLM